MSESDLVRLCSKNELPHLSDVIDYDGDIAPHRFIKLFSSVGSGKNQLINNLISGKHLMHRDGSPIKKHSVLLITPRRAMVDETRKTKGVTYDPYIGVYDSGEENWWVYPNEKENEEALIFSPRIMLPDLDGFGEQEIIQRSCVYSNAKTEIYQRDHYSQCNAFSHPWLRFDMIVIDEAHALFSDATFQSAPFYVRRLIEETLKCSQSCKVLVMTGTPEILQGDPLFEKAHTIDMMKRCISVQPQSVECITKLEAQQLQRTLLTRGEKFISFFNHIGEMLEFVETCPQDQQSKIVVTFSSQEDKCELKKRRKDLYDRIKTTQEHLAEHQKLPHDVVAFLSTSKNKEGINIKNEDIHFVFVEAHAQLDIVQMTGRLRNPAEKLYIIVDSTGYEDWENMHAQGLAKYPDTLKSLNSYYQEECRKIGYLAEDTFAKPAYEYDSLKSLIQHKHKQDDYIRFDYFSNSFMYYREREVGKHYYHAQKQRFEHAMENRYTLRMWVKSIYPEAQCTLSPQIKYHVNQQAIVDHYLESNHWLNLERTIRDKERTQILADLNQLLGTDAKTLKPLLYKFGYLFDALTKSHKKDRPYGIHRIKKQDNAA